MIREASLMSVSPRTNFLKPPPVPDTPTVIRTRGWTARNSSATASVIGKTVLDPSTATVPDRAPEPVSADPLPQPTTKADAVTTIATIRMKRKL